MRKAIWAATGAAALVWAGAAVAQTPPAAPAPGPADAKFQALYKAEWDWRMSEFPGERRGSGIAPRLGKVDAAAQAARLAHWQGVRKDLDGIAEADLSPDEAVNYEVYKDQLDTLINQQRFR